MERSKFIKAIRAHIKRHKKKADLYTQYGQTQFEVLCDMEKMVEVYLAKYK